jgi:hypothetical protein
VVQRPGRQVGFEILRPCHPLTPDPKAEPAPLAPLVHPEENGWRCAWRSSWWWLMNGSRRFSWRLPPGPSLQRALRNPTGRHKTFHKRPAAYGGGRPGSNGTICPAYPGSPTSLKRGCHPWNLLAQRLRAAASHGCINLTPSAAKWIYRWTLPIVPPKTQDVYENYGTQVDVVE